MACFLMENLVEIFLPIISDAPIPVFFNRSDTDTFYTEMADTDPILGAYHCLQACYIFFYEL